MASTLFFAFMAGLVSLLSPCTLPLLPIVVATALSEHRLGPLALAAGLSLSFAALGLLVAVAGHSLGLNEDRIRIAAAVVLMAAAIVLLSQKLQAQLASALEPFANWASAKGGGGATSGLLGQFAVGLVLGAVWSPCVGPTLGAASLMAARGENLGMVTVTMLVFGLGAGLPLAAIGLVPAAAMTRARASLATVGRGGRVVLGVLMLVTSIAVATGLDKRTETFILRLMPQWLVELTARF